MKRFLLVLLCILSFSSFSQLEKGNMYVSGNLGLTISNNSFQSFSFAPSYGFLLNEKWAVGANLFLSFNNYGSSTHLFNGGVGVFGRRYFPIAEKFYFSLIGSLAYMHREQQSFPTYHSNANGAVINVQPNFTFFPNTHWALEASIGSIGYSYFKSNMGGNAHNFDLQYGSISLGVSYYFGRGFKTND